MASYLVRDTDAQDREVTGINYGPDDARAEPGTVVELSEADAGWLLAAGVVEPAQAKPRATRSKK